MTLLKRLAVIVLAFGLVVGCASKQTSNGESTKEVSGEPIAVQKTIAFSNESDVRDAVKSECKLQTKTPKFVKQFGRRNGLNIQLVDDLDQSSIAKKLHIEITRVYAPAGGGFSGPKWMQAEATLIENGRAVASAQSRRNTTGGYFAAYKGTCDIIGRCSEAIGEDFALWLQDPEDGARLGDL